MAAGFKWSDDLSIGIPSIDEQHKKLVSLIDQLSNAMNSGKGNEVLGKIFDELITYTKTHFAYEEKLFGQYQYSDSSKHQAEHKSLTTKAVELNQKFKEGNLTLSVSTFLFLQDWLRNHIKGADKQYSSYLIEKGVR